jgi:hypothetical protein
MIGLVIVWPGMRPARHLDQRAQAHRGLMPLLPPPERRGRIGVYGAQHVERLALIGRLQRRGYSLAGIKDLLAAWDAGADLTTLLGVDSGPAALDETPLRISGPSCASEYPH